MFDAASAAPTDLLASLALRHGQRLALGHLVEAGLDALPRPGSGHTLARWRVLAAVAAHDLSLVKLFEGHTDALAILAELGGAPATAAGADGAPGVPSRPMRASRSSRPAKAAHPPDGTKAWCSGAASVTHAVVSGWNAAGEPCLAAVSMDQPGVRVTAKGWHAVGMAASASVDVRFDGAHAVQIGRPATTCAGPASGRAAPALRPAGSAARWASRAGCASSRAPRPTPTARAPRRHRGGAGRRRRAAARIRRMDRPPPAGQRPARRDARTPGRRAGGQRGHAPRGPRGGRGAAVPRRAFAQAMADLPVFLRQSHAERDLAALGQLSRQDDTQEETPPWTL
jgi:hypothetical protein